MTQLSLPNIPDFSTSQVLVVGDVMLDRYWKGASNRISPEAPVPVVKVEEKEDRAGGAANVALNIAALGATCAITGLIGNDEAGEKLRQCLAQAKVSVEMVTVPELPTITKLRVLSRSQQLLRLDFEEGFHKVDQAPILSKVRLLVKNAKVVVCSDYGKGALVSVPRMIEIANEAGVPVLIDPKGTDFEKYRGASLLTPNMSEFEAVVGKVESEDDLVARGLKLISDYGIKALLVTRSENGMTLIRPEHGAITLPTRAKEVYDVTGAGDTVIGTLAASLAAGLDLVAACMVANAAAGVVVGKVGTSVVTPHELKEALAQEDNMDEELKFGVMTKEELLVEVAKAKARGEKVVMTNGCFDILHFGHVSYLKEAREQGDRLIVAVNSDASVQRLKGPTRPINPLAERMGVLAALGAVDWVVPFDEDTPRNLIAAVLPDILVKGGDYKPEDIAGYQEVVDNGGEVKVLCFENGCSTSNVVKKILETAAK